MDSLYEQHIVNPNSTQNNNILDINHVDPIIQQQDNINNCEDDDSDDLDNLINDQILSYKNELQKYSVIIEENRKHERNYSDEELKIFMKKIMELPENERSAFLANIASQNSVNPQNKKFTSVNNRAIDRNKQSLQNKIKTLKQMRSPKYYQTKITNRIDNNLP